MSPRTIDYAAFARLGVATVYEASGKRGLIDADFVSVIPGARVAGPARTVLCGQDDNLMVHAAIERIEKGDIVVLTMPEPRAVALIGELLITQMIVRGAAGVLCDASTRDVEELATMGLPIWTRWVRVRGADKKIPGKLDVTVHVGGAAIAPGDIVILDSDGACVVALADADAVLAASEERLEREQRSRERYRNGERSYDVNDLRRVVEGSPN
jgi:4-hydroxy-4-methyl-2-oxoglutarate aldolase